MITAIKSRDSQDIGKNHGAPYYHPKLYAALT